MVKFVFHSREIASYNRKVSSTIEAARKRIQKAADTYCDTPSSRAIFVRRVLFGLSEQLRSNLL